jgi:hypothetical protein
MDTDSGQNRKAAIAAQPADSRQGLSELLSSTDVISCDLESLGKVPYCGLSLRRHTGCVKSKRLFDYAYHFHLLPFC